MPTVWRPQRALESCMIFCSSIRAVLQLLSITIPEQLTCGLFRQPALKRPGNRAIHESALEFMLNLRAVSSYYALVVERP